jgi:predicted GNAT family acetyltransferase
MPNNAASHVLDNPSWHALNTHHARFAIGTDLVKRYLSDVAFFVAFEQMNDAVRHDLEQVVAPGEFFGMQALASTADLPGWTVHVSLILVQMVCPQPPSVPESAEAIIRLTADDVPEMLDLVKLTAPGPFARRTIELGHYIGIRKDGRLIAMAGERMYLPGYREISAVCTHPDHRGKGYARLLVSILANENWARGDTPFLHVVDGHTDVISLYERLGFRRHQDIPAWEVRR